jgi:hypothetical protein
MPRIILSLTLLLAACAQDLPPAASAEEIQRAVDRAELAASTAAAKAGAVRGG